MDVVAGVIRAMDARVRPGFTLIELVLVLLIGGVVAAVTIPSMSNYLQGRNMYQARDAFMMIAAQGRAAAVEEGDLVLMQVSPATDSVVLTQRDGTLIDVLDLRDRDRRADMVGNEITICYMPRGYAHPSCRDGGDLPASIGFTVDGDTVWAELTLGRVERR